MGSTTVIGIQQEKKKAEFDIKVIIKASELVTSTKEYADELRNMTNELTNHYKNFRSIESMLHQLADLIERE